MDFTESRLIKIEGKNNDGEVLGYAVALGEDELEEFREAQIDISPRVLSLDESIAAIHGLYRMASIYSTHLHHAISIGRKAGANGHKAFIEHGGEAAHYLKLIALNGMRPEEITKLED